MSRPVFVSGVGRTVTGKRLDVDHRELVSEAVAAALTDADLAGDAPEAVVVGNMEVFEGLLHSHLDLVGSAWSEAVPTIRIDTGGATGGSVVHAGVMLVASGQADRVLVVGWEKHDNARVMDVLNAFHPGTFGDLGIGALSGEQGARWIRAHGEARVLEVAARVRVRAAEGATLNPYAHLRRPVSREDVERSPLLAWPTRLLHQCPESSGACAMVLSSSGRGRSREVVVRDSLIVRSSWGAAVRGGQIPVSGSAMEVAAQRLYRRNGISEPLRDIGLYEIYARSVWDELDRTKHFLGLTEPETIDLLESDRTWRVGDVPINPSGGVLTTNPVGAAGMLRTAEAALQIRGDAGPHQVERSVDRAVAVTVGGGDWAAVQFLEVAP